MECCFQKIDLKTGTSLRGTSTGFESDDMDTSLLRFLLATCSEICTSSSSLGAFLGILQTSMGRTPSFALVSFLHSIPLPSHAEHLSLSARLYLLASQLSFLEAQHSSHTFQQAFSIWRCSTNQYKVNSYCEVVYKPVRKT